MRPALIIFIFLLLELGVFSQPDNYYSTIEQQTEMIGEKSETDLEDDSFLMQLETLRKHRLNLNEATESDLQKLPMLNGLQIASFLRYRSLLGNLLDMYELQAVPAWDLKTVQSLLPYVTLTEGKNLSVHLAERWSKGDQALLFRYGRTLEKAKGYTAADSGSSFAGSPAKVYSRYTYNYKNLLQYGLLGEKDAGEQFLKGIQKNGFDFYSFHFHAARIGILKSIVIGDFTVDMGQGLVQWQSFGFKKSSDITLIKRQSPFLAPYRSASEAGFLRGMGITLQKSRWEWSLFTSSQYIDTQTGIDFPGNEEHFTSMLVSGYHRTEKEASLKNNVKQFSAGGRLKFSGTNWHLALNMVSYRFSKPFQKRNLPYNLFAPQGKSFFNSSVDYSFTFKNMHVFGEAAIDKKLNTAFVNGALLALAPDLDVSLVNRSISRRYGSLYGSAFTENTVPSNELGTFAGVSFRPSNFIHVEAFADVFRFPWLRYRVDAPSAGREYFIQFTYTPNKQVELTCRYRNETKQLNQSGLNLPTHPVDEFPKQSWRVHSNFELSKQLIIRHRCEITRYGKNVVHGDQGFLVFMDLFYKPSLRPWTANIRLAYFSSDSYNSRMYAYENDLGYGFAIPALFNTGYRYYFNFRLNLSRVLKNNLLAKYKMEFGIRFAQTLHPEQKTIGSGMDEIQGNTRSDAKFQMLVEF